MQSWTENLILKLLMIHIQNMLMKRKENTKKGQKEHESEDNE